MKWAILTLHPSQFRDMLRYGVQALLTIKNCSQRQDEIIIWNRTKLLKACWITQINSIRQRSRKPIWKLNLSSFSPGLEQLITFSLSPLPFPLLGRDGVQGGLDLLDVVLQLIDANFWMVTLGRRFLVHQNVQPFAVAEMNESTSFCVFIKTSAE